MDEVELDNLDDDTGQIALERMSNSPGQEGVFAKALVRIETKQKAQALKEAEHAGAQRVWRIVSGTLGSLALGLAGTALTYGLTFASDHDKVERLESVTERNGAAVSRLERETRDRLDPMQRSLTRIETQMETLLRAVDGRRAQ